MRRTELLQEIRKMRFDEAYQGWQARRLTQEEAAQLLGVHERTFRRYIDRFEREQTGTSTSRRAVWDLFVAAGDLVASQVLSR